MLVNLSVDDLELICYCIESKLGSISVLRHCGGEFGTSVRSLYSTLCILLDSLTDHLLPFSSLDSIDGVNDEANSQDAAAALPKCTASDLDQRGAGDKVSLDHSTYVEQSGV